MFGSGSDWRGLRNRVLLRTVIVGGVVLYGANQMGYPPEKLLDASRMYALPVLGQAAQGVAGWAQKNTHEKAELGPSSGAAPTTSQIAAAHPVEEQPSSEAALTTASVKPEEQDLGHPK